MHAHFSLLAAGLSFLSLLTIISALTIPNKVGFVHRDVAAGCGAAWQAGTAYSSGAIVSQGKISYVANWWTQGNNPNVSSGASGSGQPWTTQGACIGSNNSVNTTSTATSTSTAPASSTATASTATVSSASRNTTSNTQSSSASPLFFSPYKDVTINTNWNTNVISSQLTGILVPVVSLPDIPAPSWAFATGECGQETWGGMDGALFAAANVGNFSAAGIKYILSTGGAAGKFTCTTDDSFSAFLDRYASASLAGVDFDVEAGQSQADIDALVARVKVAQGNAKYAKLRYSFTIATLGGDAPKSLSTLGDTVMTSIKTAGLTNYLINLMVMDYGAAGAGNCVLSGSVCEMGLSAIQAAENLHTAYGVPYNQIELTPMIGGNDAQDEVFTLDDVTTVVSYAKEKGLAGLHHWSLDRDTDCAAGSASAKCNTYGKAGTLGFTNAFVQAL